MKMPLPRILAPYRGVILVAGCTAALLVLTTWWWQSWVSLGERIDAAKDRIARVQWVIDHEADLKQRLNAATDDKELNSTFITEVDATQATATLQKLVEQAVKDSGGNIASAQPLPSKAEGGLITISARYQIASSPAGLTQLLYFLENNRPYIFVDGADISSQPGNTAPDQGDGGSAGQLSMQLDLHAFVRAGQHG
jgi:hypothetical protein